jgi:thioredoxin reductase (NADPH)
MYDLVIIGAGPAGLTAGLYAARARLKTLAVDKGVVGGQLWNTAMVEDYPGFQHIAGNELAQKLEGHARKFGLEIVNGTVEHARRAAGHFSVKTEQDQYEALAIICTAGGSPIKLGVPGEEEYAGRGVSYCAICDGAFFTDQDIAVIGGGDSAVEEANFLTRYGKSVTLIHRRDMLKAQAILQQQLFGNPKARVIYDTAVENIVGNSAVESLHLRNTKTGERSEIAVSGVFIFIGFRPNTWFLPEHLAHDQSGYLITNERMETSVEGIYAAGDVRVQLFRQVSTAVGDGTVAALAAEQYITRKKSGVFDVRDWWYKPAVDKEEARPKA